MTRHAAAALVALLLAAPAPAYAWPWAAGEGAYQAGLACEAADGVPLDEAAASAHFARAVADGHPVAARRLGLRALASGGSSDEARRWLRIAAERGDVPAARALGALDAASDEGRRWLTFAAERGDVRAAALLGFALEARPARPPVPSAKYRPDQPPPPGGRPGQPPPPDPAAVRAWYERAAAGGDEAAMQRLDVLDASGPAPVRAPAVRPADLDERHRVAVSVLARRPPAVDAALAIAWLEQAAEAGHRRAARYLALDPIFYADPARRTAWRRRAADLGLAGAALQLAHDARQRPGDDALAEARRLYALAAQAPAGHPVAATGSLWLARLAKHGGGGPVDLHLALRHARAAAEGGEADARPLLASFLAGPDGTLRVKDPTLRLAGRAAPQVTVPTPGLLAIAEAWDRGQGTWPDPAEARRWYLAAAEREDPTALLWLADHAEQAQRRGWMLRAAAAGVLSAKRRLPAVLRPDDRPRATAWTLRLADDGERDFQIEAARLLLEGDGVPRNARAARARYRRAAEAGLGPAWEPYGRMLLAGEGGPVDRAGALAIWTRGAEAGHPDSAGLAGALVWPTAKTAAERAQALAWLAAGAEGGDMRAARLLGEALEAGRGFAPDRAGARRAYEAAIENGDAAAEPDGPIVARRLLALLAAERDVEGLAALAEELDDVPLQAHAADLLDKAGAAEAAAEVRAAAAEALEEQLLDAFEDFVEVDPADAPPRLGAVRVAVEAAAYARHPAALAIGPWLGREEKGPEGVWEAAVRGYAKPLSKDAVVAWKVALAMAGPLGARLEPEGGVDWAGLDVNAVASEAQARQALANARPHPRWTGAALTAPRTPDDWVGRLFARKAQIPADPAERDKWEAIAIKYLDPIALVARAKRLEAKAPAEAHVLFNLAAARGHISGPAGRTRTAARLTPAQRLAAEDQAAARWQPPALF